MKVLSIFFFTEVLQKAYYRNVKNLEEVSFDLKKNKRKCIDLCCSSYF